jgi:hypothetical protein
MNVAGYLVILQNFQKIFQYTDLIDIGLILAIVSVQPFVIPWTNTVSSLSRSK